MGLINCIATLMASWSTITQTGRYCDYCQHRKVQR
jgi:hypothetical protein